MKRLHAGLPVLFLYVASLGAADPGGRIREVIENSPAGRAFWGIQVVDLDSGRTVFEMNSNRLFTPASNTKLFSTALGLIRLGPDYRFSTLVTAAAPVSATGVVNGDLVLVGGGDPNLSGRAVPYRMGSNSQENPLQAIEDLAGQLWARGLREVRGAIAGDDSRYVWEPYPEGWAADDGIWDYGAAVSALALNDNVLSLTITPGARAGTAAAVTLSPPVEFYHIDNRVRTVSGGAAKLTVDRLPGSEVVRVWGSVPAGSQARTVLLGIHEPALYAAVALRDSLIRRGVTVRGPAVARHAYPNQFESLETAPPAAAPAGVELARRESAPLAEDLRITNKVSQNLHAEMVLRAVARARRNIGSRQAGLLELADFLKEVGIEKSEYEFNDGSGLSRMNLVSPAAVVKLLRYLYASPQRDLWMGLLPVAGEDGTLNARFKGTAGAGRIRAKTGTIAHVNALSGYAETNSGRRLAFAILVNNSGVPNSEVRSAIDKIGSLIVE